MKNFTYFFNCAILATGVTSGVKASWGEVLRMSCRTVGEDSQFHQCLVETQGLMSRLMGQR